MLLLLIIVLLLTVMMLLTVHNFLQIVTMFKIAKAVMLQTLNVVLHLYLDAITSVVHLRQSGRVISNTNQAVIAGYYYFAGRLLLCISS